MKTKLKALLFTATLTTSLLLGQTTTPTQHQPPSPADMAARRVAMLTRRLSLTADQQTQATTIFTAAATANATTYTSLSSVRQQLNDAVKANNTAAINQAANTIGTLTTTLTASDAKANAAFYAILTPDQQTKFNSSHGPGGFGGAGFGRGAMNRFRGPQGGTAQSQ